MRSHAPHMSIMGDARFRRAFERLRDAPSRAEAIRDLSDGDVIAALGGAVDQGDPLLANILATEAQNRLTRPQALAASVGEAILVMDSTWRVTMVNPAAERLLQWRSSELVGSELHATIHTFCTEPGACHLGEAPPPDFFYQNDDALVLRKDGRSIRVAYTVTPMTRAGTTDGGVVLIRDSSERKRQEERAFERQDRLAMILATLAEGILTMDLHGRITYANPAAERIIGRPARDLLERTYYDPSWDYLTPTGDIHPIPNLPFKRVIESGLPALDEQLGIRRGDGTTTLLAINTIPLPDANGVPYAIVASFVEVPNRNGDTPS